MALLNSFDNVPFLSAASVLMISLTALIGWAIGSDILKGFASNLPTMKITTAIALLLGGTSLLLLHRKLSNRWVGWLCAAGMALIGILTLCEYLFGWDLGIDHFVATDFSSHTGIPPGRMAVVSAINVSLIGISLLLLHKRDSQRAAYVFIIPASCLTLLSSIDFLYSTHTSSRLAPFDTMAINTTFAFASLCVGTLCAMPGRGIVDVLRLPGSSGAFARRLIPASVIIPLTIGWIRLKGQQFDLYGTESGVAIFAVTNILIMVSLIVWSAGSLSRLEREREENVLALRRQTEALQRQAELIDLANDAIIVADSNRVITSWNGGAEKLYGWKQHEAVGQVIHQFLQTTSAISSEEIDKILRTRHRWEGELTHTRKDGRKIVVDSRHILPELSIGEAGSFLEINRDITNQKQLQDQFLQSQKLESLGQLAGGVAHDFNNLLTIILGYSEFILEQMPGDHPIRSEVEEIAKAGKKASSLTRQLLLFSRRQTTPAVTLTLNSVVLDLEKMLIRLIGEDIELNVSVDAEASAIQADPGQIEQVVMNLAVNARDAMPDGGRLLIETATAHVDAEYAGTHLSLSTGKYAVLVVSDNGIGMTADVKAHIFEPFFTTKEQGKGTGLGLSTVYGIVKQSGGDIFVYSEPGLGTTFKMYFPAVQDAVLESRSAVKPGVLDGTETILLAEDEEPLRRFIQDVMTRHGYTVIIGANGRETLEIARRYEGRIHLLLSDVVMPEMGGPELAEEFAAVRPDVPVLLMSGYADRMWRKDVKAKLVQKPFTPNELLSQIRTTLSQNNNMQ